MVGPPIGWQCKEWSWCCPITVTYFFHLCFLCHPVHSGFLCCPLNSLSLPPHTSLLCFFLLFAEQGRQRTEDETAISSHYFKSHLQCLYPYLTPQIGGGDWPLKKARQNPPKEDSRDAPNLLEGHCEHSRVQGSHQKITLYPKPYKNQGLHFSASEPSGSGLGGAQRRRENGIRELV